VFLGQFPHAPGRAAMTVALFTPDRAYAAALRSYGAHDALRLALAVAWGRYGEDDARAELATTLAWHAEQSGIRTVSCRALAAAMLEEQIDIIEARHRRVLQQMIAAVEAALTANPRDVRGAAAIAAEIAKDNGAPADLVESALHIARWRVRRTA
jgi:hypothetical protein